MSPANVEVVRRAYHAFNAHDWEGMLRGFDAEVEWRTDPLAPDAGVYRGHQGVLDLLKHDWASTFDDLRVEVDGITALDGDRVVVCTRLVGKIRGTGAVVDQEFAELVTLRDGRLWRVEDFPDRSRALRAAEARE